MPANRPTARAPSMSSEKIEKQKLIFNSKYKSGFRCEIIFVFFFFSAERVSFIGSNELVTLA